MNPREARAVIFRYHGDPKFNADQQPWPRELLEAAAVVKRANEDIAVILKTTSPDQSLKKIKRYVAELGEVARILGEPVGHFPTDQ